MPFPEDSLVVRIVPEAPISNQATLALAWSCAGGAAEVLEFSSGVRVTYQSGFEAVDPDAKWPDLVKQDGGRVSEVGGVATYVGTDAPGYAHRFIQAIVAGTLIQVMGRKDSAESDLEEVLRSIIERSDKAGY